MSSAMENLPFVDGSHMPPSDSTTLCIDDTDTQHGGNGGIHSWTIVVVTFQEMSKHNEIGWN